MAELAQAKVDQQSAIENAQAAHNLNNGHKSSGGSGGSDEMPMQPPQQQQSQKKEEKEEKNEPDPNAQYLQPVKFEIPTPPDALNTPSRFSKIVPPEQLVQGWTSE